MATEQELAEADELLGSREPREVRPVEQNIVWKPANYLPDPPQIPGWRHYWKRAETYGVRDKVNMAQAMREGWEPCAASDYPVMTRSLFGRGEHPDIIEFGGLVLCRMPEEMAKQREAYFTNKAKGMLRSINDRLRENAGDERIRFENESRTEIKRTA